MPGTRTSRWTAGAVALCLLLLVAAWFLLVAPRRAEASDLQSQRELAATQNNQLELDIAQLKAEAAQLPARQAELAKIKIQFPDGVQMPKLIRDLDSMATLSGITLDSLSPGQPSAVSQAATVATSGAAAASGGSNSASGGSTAAKPTASSLLQVPVTFQLTGDYFQVAAFVKRLQSMQRLILITQVQMNTAATDGDPGTVSATLNAQVYVLPDEAVTARATSSPGAPASPGASNAPPGNLGSGPAQSQTTAPGIP